MKKLQIHGMEMNQAERFRAVMNFRTFDRLPRIEWAAWWDQTLTRWKSEGLPPVCNTVQELNDYFGFDRYVQLFVNPIPAAMNRRRVFGQGLLATADDYRALRPEMYGEYDIEELPGLSAEQIEGQAVIWFTLYGFFWTPRILFGIERHMYSFYDLPELLHRINQDLADFHIRMLKRLCPICQPTFMTFAEDMSYNHGPMLSKPLFDEFLAPYYRQVIPVLEEFNIIPFVDTDGDVTALVPWLQEVGIRGVLPLERQAGVDGATLRKSFPKLGMIGHYDKMVMSKGPEAMRREFERLLPLMKTGGFIASVDHQTPPEVSLEQYRSYLRLLEEYSLKAAE